MAYATAEEVGEVLARTLTPEETALVNRRLDQAERLILRRIPDLAQKIAAGELDEADVVDVETEAVLRVVRNPDGYLSRVTARISTCSAAMLQTTPSGSLRRSGTASVSEPAACSS